MAAAVGVVGWWVGLAEAVSLAVAVWMGILEELVLRAASVEEGEVARERAQVGQLDAIEPGWSVSMT